MTYYFSPSTSGFYLDTVHKTKPNDCIALTDENYHSIINNQNGAQKIAVVDGKVKLVDKVIVITWDMIRAKRDELISATDWTQLNDVPDETKDKYVPYRQALRDITETFLSPESVVWPTLAQFGIES